MVVLLIHHPEEEPFSESRVGILTADLAHQRDQRMLEIVFVRAVGGYAGTACSDGKDAVVGRPAPRDKQREILGFVRCEFVYRTDHISDNGSQHIPLCLIFSRLCDHSARACKIRCIPSYHKTYRFSIHVGKGPGKPDVPMVALHRRSAGTGLIYIFSACLPHLEKGTGKRRDV